MDSAGASGQHRVLYVPVAEILPADGWPPRTGTRSALPLSAPAPHRADSLDEFLTNLKPSLNSARYTTEKGVTEDRSPMAHFNRCQEMVWSRSAATCFGSWFSQKQLMLEVTCGRRDTSQ